MEYTFKARAIVWLTQAINLWPVANRAQAKIIDELAVKIEMDGADLVAVNWRTNPDGGASYQPDVELVRELDDADRALLRHMAENPPASRRPSN